MSTIITRSTDFATIEPLLVLHEWVSEAEPRTIVHPILGSEDFSVTLRPASMRTGIAQLLFRDADAAESARAFHRAPAVFVASSDMSWFPASYVPNGVIRVRPGNGKHWVLELPFQELAA